MRRFVRYYFGLAAAVLICAAVFASWYFAPGEMQAIAVVPPVFQTKTPDIQETETGEILLSETENAYNPIPNADGSLIAYVRTGWYREKGSGGFGSSNLVSDIAVMNADGNVLTEKPLADAFLQGWTSDDKYLICSRDGEYSIISPDGKILLSGRLPARSDSGDVSEQIAFLSTSNSVLWLQNYFADVKRKEISPGSFQITSKFIRSAIESPGKEFAKLGFRNSADSVLVPSPDEKYIALIGRENLRVYDIEKASWTDLGKIIIHPDDDRDFIKPSWNPWFADGSRLVFMTASGIVVSSPDGKSRQNVFKPKQASGLPVSSPDGTRIAFATFEPRPIKERADLKFWGGSTIWIVPVAENSTARDVSKKNPDTTYSLRWLNDHALVFDRVADEMFYKKARLWKVDVKK